MNHTGPLKRTNFQAGQDIEFRVIVTNDKAIFTNENLYMNSILKILQIDLSTQLTSRIWGIQYLVPYPGPGSLSSYEKQIPQCNPYNNLSGI